MNTKLVARFAAFAFVTSAGAAERALSPDPIEARIVRVEQGFLPAVIIQGRALPGRRAKRVQ